MTTGGRKISVDYIARVEGEASLQVVIDGGEVQDVRLSIFEPPRFFEALLRGRNFREAPDITSRICGICPIAYMMGAVHAMEDICGVRVDGPLRELRRLIYCGEWIESHVLHIGMLHLPDFLGYPDAISMAGEHPELVERTLRLKRLGNRIIQLLGGREIHPINVRVGGFYSLPGRDALTALRDELAEGLEDARTLLTDLNALDYPDFEGNWDFVALHPGHEYPFNEGPVGCSGSADMLLPAYDDFLEEVHMPHSTALHAVRTDGRPQPVALGAMARFALNREQLTPLAAEAAEKAGLSGPCRNPYRSIQIRAVEVLFAFEEALRILDAYTPPEHAFIEVEPRAGTGYGCTEAPRGACYHRYRIDDDGLITDARIMPPTAVNQRAIEQDLKSHVGLHLDEADEVLRQGCERIIRNYDPCISCAAHFLKLDIRSADGRQAGKRHEQH